jgi:hypothetical protein
VGQPSNFMNGEQWSQLYFENCRIPKGNLLLGAGGFKKQISGFNVERLGNARALALGRHASTWRVSTPGCASSSAASCASSRAFSGSLPRWMKLEQAQLLQAPREGEHGLPSAKHGHGQAGLQLAAGKRRTKPCRSWAAWVSARKHWSSTACAAPAAG